jgi:hypothetical protein
MENNITKEECLEIISTLHNPQTKEEKYKFHLAVTYIRENIADLENKDLQGIIGNEQFMRKIGDEFEKKLTHRYINFNMKSFNKEQCIEVFNTIDKPKSSAEKYKCHLALTYFKENIASFEDQEIKNIISNDYVKKYTGKKFSSEVMSQCIKQGKSLAVILPEWASGSIPKPTLDGYIELINNESNVEQLKFFCAERQYEVRDFVLNSKKKISPLLAELYLKVDPQYIYQIDWSDEKKCLWLENNQNSMDKIFGSLYLYEEIINQSFKNKIYECAKNKMFITNPQLENITFANFVLKNNNINFLKHIKTNYPHELNQLLSVELEHFNRDNMKLNLIQYLIDSGISVDENQNNAANTLFEIICDNKALLLAPIKLQTRLYEREITFFEHGLNNASFLMFAPFNLNDVVEAQHKEPILAAAFCLLQAKHGAFDNSDDGYGYDSEIYNYEFLKKWYPQIIEQATSEQITRYADRALKGNEDNTNLVKEINALKLKAELNQDLSDNNPTPKAKVKI